MVTHAIQGAHGVNAKKWRRCLSNYVQSSINLCNTLTFAQRFATDNLHADSSTPYNALRHIILEKIARSTANRCSLEVSSEGTIQVVSVT